MSVARASFNEAEIIVRHQATPERPRLSHYWRPGFAARRYARATMRRVSTSATAMHVACGFTAVGLGNTLVSQM